MNPEALTHLFQEELYRFSNPVAVVLPKPWESYVAEEQLLLKKILTSVKTDFNAIGMVVQPSVDLKSLSHFNPERVLVFGCEITDDIPFYQETAAHGFMVVRADDLSLLDDQKKKNLWAALRKMFGM